LQKSFLRKRKKEVDFRSGMKQKHISRREPAQVMSTGSRRFLRAAISHCRLQSAPAPEWAHWFFDK